MTATLSLRSVPTTSLNAPPRKPTPAAAGHLPIRCGPRDNRGPLVKGRSLSTEAIQAVQSLKRAHRADPAAAAAATALPSHLCRSLTRLLKSDLLAVLRELLRQDRCALALQVLAVVRSEYRPVELSLYADVASALARQGMGEEIDALVEELELEREGSVEWGDKAVPRLLKAVIGAGRRESTVRIYGLMRRSGWGPGARVEDHAVKVLSRGLRRLGEVGLADEIDEEFVYGHDRVQDREVLRA